MNGGKTDWAKLIFFLIFFICIVIGGALMRSMEEVMKPVVLSVFMSFIFFAPVKALNRKFKIPWSLGITIVFVVFFAFFFGLGNIIVASFKSILTNKPLLLITLSEFLGAFSIGSGVNYYYINVLGLATMSTIVGIPGAIVSPLSYSYVPWAREKFSTKTLWIFGSHISDFLMVGVFLVGSINKNYKKLGAMIPAFMLRETIWMFFWGIRSVIPEEMRNESIDYGEWKNGYRNEGLTGVAKELPRKLINTFGNTIKAAILKQVGYVEGAGFGG
ncbi:MAG: AI-2E family transporter, partial [Treponema sp.]|nr:AI-2E family transporter [Treponema sp.]